LLRRAVSRGGVAVGCGWLACRVGIRKGDDSPQPLKEPSGIPPEPYLPLQVSHIPHVNLSQPAEKEVKVEGSLRLREARGNKAQFSRPFYEGLVTHVGTSVGPPVKPLKEIPRPGWIVYDDIGKEKGRQGKEEDNHVNENDAQA